MENRWASEWSDSYIQARASSRYSFSNLIALYTPGLGAVFSVSAPEPFDWAFVILFTAIAFGSLETAIG
jgi:hypothetical protein